MEKVKDIRAEIANNAARTKSKILLKDLRDISRLYSKYWTEEGLSDEEYYRYSIIKNAIRSKDTDRLRSVQIIANRALGGIKPPCAGTKRGGVAYDGATKQGRGKKTL